MSSPVGKGLVDGAGQETPRRWLAFGWLVSFGFLITSFVQVATRVQWFPNTGVGSLCWVKGVKKQE